MWPRTPGPRLPRVTSQLPSPTEVKQEEGAGDSQYHLRRPKLHGHRAKGGPASPTPAEALGRPFPLEAGLRQGQGPQSMSHEGCFPTPSGRMQGCVYGLHLGNPVGLLEENLGQSGGPPETGIQGAFLS